MNINRSRIVLFLVLLFTTNSAVCRSSTCLESSYRALEEQGLLESIANSEFQKLQFYHLHDIKAPIELSQKIKFKKDKTLLSDWRSLSCTTITVDQRSPFPGALVGDQCKDQLYVGGMPFVFYDIRFMLGVSAWFAQNNIKCDNVTKQPIELSCLVLFEAAYPIPIYRFKLAKCDFIVETGAALQSLVYYRNKTKDDSLFVKFVTKCFPTGGNTNIKDGINLVLQELTYINTMQLFFAFSATHNKIRFRIEAGYSLPRLSWNIIELNERLTNYIKNCVTGDSLLQRKFKDSFLISNIIRITISIKP